ncbi:ABC-2 transporter permease ['Paenibacillus yunnanensis' Narsing Rao et al. 2020]|uniref:ABC-2 transporter permease n=1 Tax=Paenibacillus tengchongensis TaxID=2608684 RepID=UPI00124DE871|nr:ABC-2 transporter permease [Paenibacillus tengchongensis]
MKGLLINNYYSMQDNIKLSFGIALAVVLIPLFASGSKVMSMIIAVQTFVFASNMGTSLQMDETSKWNKWELTLPVTRTAVINAKYISFIFLITMGLASSLVTLLLHGFIGELDVNAVIDGYLFGLQLAITSIAIVYPLILKLGAEKSDVLLLTAAGLSIGLKMVIWYILYMFNNDINFNGRTVGIVSTLAALLLFAVSYLISARIQRHKEF